MISSTMPSPKRISIIAITLLLAILIQFLIRAKQCVLNPITKSQKKTTNTLALPPGPKPWPLIGSLPEMLIAGMHRPAFRWIHDLMARLDTDIACIRLGNVHVIPVTSPEIAREFLRKHDSSFASRPFTMAAEIASGGYLTAGLGPEGEQWNKMRKLVSAHVLNPSKFHFLRHLRDQEADNLVRYVYNSYCNNNRDSSSRSPIIVDVRMVARQYCGNVFTKMMFGQSCFDGEYVESGFRVTEHLYAFSPSDYVPLLRWLDLDGHGRIVKEGMRNINKYQHPIVEERVRLWRDGKRVEPQDMLDFLILAQDSNKQHLSIDEIKAQCAEFVLATLDNPSNIVEWILAEMINQPKILQMATEELDKIVGKERLVQEFDLPSLNYVKACVNEAFRLHPIASFIFPHVSTVDTVVSGYFIPKNSHVLISRMAIGRDPKVWKNPLAFDPNRHLRKDNARIELTDPDLKFISFGTGRRGCIGISLGSVMTLMLLARLIQGFSWNSPPDKKEIDLAESEGDFFMKYPLHAIVHPRLSSTVYNTI